MRNRLEVPISSGELLDKITILEIKLANICEPEKRKNIMKELNILESVSAQNIPASDKLAFLTAKLREINQHLWTLEDEIRAYEDNGDFGKRFVACARSIYRTNDARAQVKREINLLLRSDIVEEKSYARYGGDGGQNTSSTGIEAAE